MKSRIKLLAAVLALQAVIPSAIALASDQQRLTPEQIVAILETTKNFESADLRGANLNGANLEGASFVNANLADATLQNANLRFADFKNADIGGADFSGANLTGARNFETAVNFDKLIWRAN